MQLQRGVRPRALCESVDPEIDGVGLNDRPTAIFDRLDRSTRLSPTLSTQLDSGQRWSTRSTSSTCQFTPHSRYETIVIPVYIHVIQYIVTVVTVSCDRIIGCSLNLWFTFILYKTRSSAVAVIADHTAYHVVTNGILANYQTSLVYKLSAIRFSG